MVAMLEGRRTAAHLPFSPRRPPHSEKRALLSAFLSASWFFSWQVPDVKQISKSGENIKPNFFKGKLLISGRVERLGADETMMPAGITTSRSPGHVGFGLNKSDGLGSRGGMGNSRNFPQTRGPAHFPIYWLICCFCVCSITGPGRYSNLN